MQTAALAPTRESITFLWKQSLPDSRCAAAVLALLATMLLVLPGGQSASGKLLSSSGSLALFNLDGPGNFCRRRLVVHRIAWFQVKPAFAIQGTLSPPQPEDQTWAIWMLAHLLPIRSGRAGATSNATNDTPPLIVPVRLPMLGHRVKSMYSLAAQPVSRFLRQAPSREWDG